MKPGPADSGRARLGVWWCVLAFMLAVSPPAPAQEADDAHRARGVVPDVRDEPPPASAARGNFVGVPIPFTNPTLDTGLVLGAAWFHGQTEAQKAVQPPSVTGGGIMYSKSGSYAVAAGHSSYWSADRWRFKGLVGYGDFDLPLLGPSAGGMGPLSIDWQLSGTFVYSELSRRVLQDWYLGVAARWIDLDQSFSFKIDGDGFALGDALTARSLGLKLSYDSRDMPTNAYQGRYFELTAMANRNGKDRDASYTSYGLAYRAYHRLRPSLVFAWEAAACHRTEGVGLWDACTLGLRGPAATDYVARTAYRAQAEARWTFSERWGVVAFAGGGRVSNSLSASRDNETIPSYGLGLRFMVQRANRINMRLDFAQSNNDEAIILSVREAF